MRRPPCERCDSTGYVREDHPDRPWGGLSARSCPCGGAGALCPDCKRAYETLARQVAVMKAANAVSDCASVGDCAMAWTHYHALGEALRATGVEPPQPPVGV